ncbi:hypothetical protein [Pseudomonas fluorescens]|uniref:hypothetical protein n=1 Tax=Pseudomonas fluorescens TaxID=294 RepID=UPI000A60C78C|nr:hypothetical protein [Pseudomonas fluorescens]
MSSLHHAWLGHYEISSTPCSGLTLTRRNRLAGDSGSSGGTVAGWTDAIAGKPAPTGIIG